MQISATLRASTDELAAADRFPYWADVVTQTFVPLECDAPARRNFSGHIRHRRVARVGVTEVSASAQRVRRTRAKIAQAPSDDLIVVVHVDGQCHVGQRSEVAALGAGEGAVVSACDTYFFEFPESFRQIVLKVPRALLRVAPADDATHTRFRLASGPARLLRQLALGVLDASDDVTADEELSVERAFIELLRSATARVPSDNHHDAASARYAAAVSFIAQNSADPGLNPALVAAHVGLSTRSLSRLFAMNGRTIERTIWSHRLERARDELADPQSRHKSITEIAFSCGFNDAAHFSRSFLNVFGVTPKQFRVKG